MEHPDWLATRFEETRPHLRRVAYRMLGSASEAEDAVQEAWLRLARADTAGVSNLGGWLTTVVARVCLDTLRARRARPEEPLDPRGLEPAAGGREGGPEQDAVLADSMGLALLVVLETLSPAERVAFVLHDLFDLPFDEIAPIVGRTPAAARQLASRARRRVREGGAAADASPAPPADRRRQREVVDAFLAASRGGDFAALLAMLDPEAVLRADEAAVLMGASKEVRGAAAVAETLSGRARAARPALVGGAVGLVWAPGGVPRVAFGFTITGGKVAAIDLIADPERLERLEIVLLDK